jgi:hypothetical protein
VRSEIIAAGNKMHDYSDEEEERKVKKMCWYFRLRYQQTKENHKKYQSECLVKKERERAHIC